MAGKNWNLKKFLLTPRLLLFLRLIIFRTFQWSFFTFISYTTAACRLDSRVFADFYCCSFIAFFRCFYHHLPYTTMILDSSMGTRVSKCFHDLVNSTPPKDTIKPKLPKKNYLRSVNWSSTENNQQSLVIDEFWKVIEHRHVRYSSFDREKKLKFSVNILILNTNRNRASTLQLRSSRNTSNVEDYFFNCKSFFKSYFVICFKLVSCLLWLTAAVLVTLIIPQV